MECEDMDVQTRNAGGGYRSRYLAFLKQRHPETQNGASRAVLGLGKGVINITIFIALVICILTIFGFGLTRLTSQQTTTRTSKAASQSTSMQVSEGGLIVPPTVYPSGHAVDPAPASRRTERGERSAK